MLKQRLSKKSAHAKAAQLDNRDVIREGETPMPVGAFSESLFKRQCHNKVLYQVRWASQSKRKVLLRLRRNLSDTTYSEPTQCVFNTSADRCCSGAFRQEKKLREDNRRGSCVTSLASGGPDRDGLQIGRAHV